MPISLQQVPFGENLKDLCMLAKNEIKICSPFITTSGSKYILGANIIPKIITKVTAANLSSNALDGNLLKEFLKNGVKIRSVPNLHAKIYLLDSEYGIVTSSNLTGPGLVRNVELGLLFINEPEIFAKVNTFYEDLWNRAINVSCELLEQILDKKRSLIFDNGLWKNRFIENQETVLNEELEPCPAIGELVMEEIPLALEMVNIQGEKENVIAQVDESGDIFAELPRNVDEIKNIFLSTNLQLKQGLINTLEYLPPVLFEKWIKNILTHQEISKLFYPEIEFPYKRRFIKNCIRKGSGITFSLIIVALTSNPSIENQLLQYLQAVKEKASFISLDELEVSKISTAIYDHVLKLAQLYESSSMNKKNFVLPNLHRIVEIFSLIPNFSIEKIQNEINKIKVVELSKKVSIPGFQEIKRMRETQGSKFIQNAEDFFEQISKGLWNNSLPSILALLSELNKVTLGNNDKVKIKRKLVEFLNNIEPEIQNTSECIRDKINEVLENFALLEREQQELIKAKMELPSKGRYFGTTGRLVSVYGILKKSRKILPNRDFKKEMDYLSTFLNLKNKIELYISKKD